MADQIENPRVPGFRNIQGFSTPSGDKGIRWDFLNQSGELSSQWSGVKRQDGRRIISGRGINQTYAPMPVAEPSPVLTGTMLLGDSSGLPELPRLMVDRNMRFGVPMSDERRNQHLDYLQTKYDLNYMDAVGRERTMLLGKDEDRQNMVLGEMLQRTRPVPYDPKAGLMPVGGTGIWDANKGSWAVEPKAAEQTKPFEANQGPTVFDEKSGMIGVYDPKVGAYEWRDRPKLSEPGGKEVFAEIPADMPRYQHGGQAKTAAAPQQPQYREGMTATGPDGQKVIFRNGQWVSM